MASNRDPSPTTYGSSARSGLNTPGVGRGPMAPARRSHANAAKATAARLQKVMKSHSVEDDEEEDEYHSSSLRGGGLTPSYGASSQDISSRFQRHSQQTGHRDMSPRIRPSSFNNVGDLSAVGVGSNSLQTHRPLSSSHLSNHQVTNSQRPAGSALPILTVPPRVSEPASEIVRDAPPTARRTKFPSFDTLRSTPDLGRNGGLEEAALRDEIDVLQEDNEALLEKLRSAEEKLQEKESRNRELEKQIAGFGEGISMEAKLLSRKEAALRQRELALRAEKEQTKDVKDDEIAALRLEADTSRDEAASAVERAAAAEKEASGLRSVTRRMVLTEDEMEEMVLKRCWLARYWGLATRHNVLAEVASSKHEHWSALAPLPLEVVISAGHSDTNGAAGNRQTPSIRDLNDISGEANVESMLAVEKGLRELALLNIEQAVMLSISRNHDPSLDRTELSAEEIEDVQFKHAWLVYFWRRARHFNVEKDIANERLTYWITRSNQPPTSHDVVDVARGLAELHKLGVEEQLWEASRREVAQAASN